MLGKLKEWWLTRNTVSHSVAFEDFHHLYTDPPQSFSNKYPDVPGPDEPLSPTILAARWTSHDLSPEDMPSIAADLLEAGFDTPTLRRLAGEMQMNSSADAEPLVSRVFHEIGVNYPLREGEAKFIAVRQIAREVIAGNRNPWAAASHIEIVICGFVPDSVYLKAICSLHDEIGRDLSYRRPSAALNAELLEAFAKLAKVGELDDYLRLE